MTVWQWADRCPFLFCGLLAVALTAILVAENVALRMIETWRMQIRSKQ